MASSGIKKKIGIASLIMMASVLLSRFIGLFREMVIAWQGGTSAAVDAYQIAFIIPEILNHILASGFLSVTFIPIFSKYLAAGEEEKGYDLCNAILTVFGMLLLAVILISMVFAPQLISWLAPGMKNPVLRSQAVKMTRIIIPAQFFFFAGGLFTAVQFAREKFAIPALAPLVYNLGIIFGGILLARKYGMEGFSWGVLAGSFLGNFLLQYYGAKRIGYGFKWNFDFLHPDLKKYLVLTLPLTLGITMMFSTEIFMRFFGSFLSSGSIAGINYALRILFILVGLFGQAVGIASFPYLARYVAENKLEEMNRLINDTLSILALVIPVSVLLMVLRYEVVAILFQRGNFNMDSVRITADALAYLLLGTYGFAAQTIVVRGFYAIQNTLFPSLFGTAAVILSLPFYYFGIKLMGVNGLCLAISMSTLIQVITIHQIWNRRFSGQSAVPVFQAVLKMVVISVPLGLFLEWFRRLLLSLLAGKMVVWLQNTLVAVILSLLFLMIFTALGQIFKVEEVRSVTRRIAGLPLWRKFGRPFGLKGRL